MSPSVSPRARRTPSNSPLSTPTTTTDPFSLALQPPPTETAAEKAARIQSERLAKQRSDEIDKLLRQPPSTSPKGREYKMVLLGQAGAGKTTVLKQMRLLYDPQAHERERRGWTKIVLLNTMCSVRVLLETMERFHQERKERRSSELDRLESEGGEVGPKNERNEARMPWAAHLGEVVRLEMAMRRELGAFGEEAEVPDTAPGKSGQARPLSSLEGKSRGGLEKSPLILRPGWQERLFTYARRSLSHSRTQPESSPSDTDDDPALIFLRTIQSDILSLWSDASCRALRHRGLFLDAQTDSPTTYFLDSLPRILSPTYTPNDEDILHSRVRTLGITSHTFRIDRTLLYTIYDVGGSRSQRHAWASYLDDVGSIIFLAPLSAFDQPLVEDPGVNRLEDSFALFSQVVSNPLLRGASIVLFLNKIDLLEQKLRSGIQLGRYWAAYQGDNDFEAVWRWFRGKFRDCVREVEEKEAEGEKRRLYVHTTVATSSAQIRAILMSVKDTVLRENLRVTGLVG
ncbi:Guanine nucleotide binding protein (G-protein), alpha subunit [Kalmanozyma brasiliensis GHG001]|uniref:G-alpha protein n=1 Tax=Kalmanozyma brasiliensis (strain GHG001) TaxID=1365824 RepID=V5GML2_KALBG|nr:Guanine nucleotide binding protein (G-protein), alpha subunit [Kalmanozyma brasiliensis GHG001]EST07202.1 Guanine nucleotide binding protein (G-protein), alpha subunit [Kalmanozyma brasiliensis GHG001]